MITISMPLFIEMGFKCKARKPILDKQGNKIPRKYHLNMNNYRNWHYQTSNKLKVRYKEIAEDRLMERGMDIIRNPVDLSFFMYRGDNRKIDRSNVCSIHEKFFCDALVELGFITDDEDKYITSTHYYSGGLDKANPRVDIVIKE